MKKFKLMALALVIGSASLFAANVEAPDEVPVKEIRSQIIELLKAPDFPLVKDVNVVIKFTFSSIHCVRHVVPNHCLLSCKFTNS